MSVTVIGDFDGIVQRQDDRTENYLHPLGSGYRRRHQRGHEQTAFDSGRPQTLI
jgi:hypothetical protein